MKPHNFFAELKRRNVYKVAVAYGVVGWLVMQVAATIVPALHLSEAITSAVVLLTLLGFPIALVLAWAFELTPEGIKRAEDVLPNESITPRAGRKLVGITIALAIVAAGLLLFQFTRSHSSSSSPNPGLGANTTIPEKSVAVLPFENLSSDKENAYFAAGIQDEILTRLAKIGGLKVISRSSTQQYQRKPVNLREIALQLGVANILEGSVQKAGTAVHVNVQLIKAATDDHLWAESYDRTLDNIFGVEGEIAQTVAEALKAKLTGAEEKVLAQKPTNNSAAYDAYLRGTEQSRRRGEEDQVRASQGSFEEAVRLDPKFAAAWAALSRTHSLLFFHYDATPARRAEAQKALTEALRLQPDLAEVQLAKAYFQYWVLRDYMGSLEMMRQLRTSWPSNAEVLEVMAYISARLGQWKDSLNYIQESVVLNPKEPQLRIQAIQIALAMRDFAVVTKMTDDALQIWPDNSEFLASKAFALLGRGQLNEAQAILTHATFHMTKMDALSLALVYQIILRRDQAGARTLLDSYPLAADEKDPTSLTYSAILQETADRREDARAKLTRACNILESLVKALPDNAELVGPLAFVQAALGQRDETFKALEKFASLTVGDARGAGQLEEVRARTCARLGDKECAINSLARLLSMPSDGIFGVPVTPAILRLDPAFDPLRGDPRFEKLAAGKP